MAFALSFLQDFGGLHRPDPQSSRAMPRIPPCCASLDVRADGWLYRRSATAERAAHRVLAFWARGHCGFPPRLCDAGLFAAASLYAVRLSAVLLCRAVSPACFVGPLLAAKSLDGLSPPISSFLWVKRSHTTTFPASSLRLHAV
jgi:hypothetical protein